MEGTYSTCHWLFSFFSTLVDGFSLVLPGSRTAVVLSTVQFSKSLLNYFCLNPNQIPKPISLDMFSQRATDQCGISQDCMVKLSACQGWGTGCSYVVKGAAMQDSHPLLSSVAALSNRNRGEKSCVVMQHFLKWPRAHRDGVLNIDALNDT